MTSKSTRTIKPQQALEEYLSALLSPNAKAAAPVAVQTQPAALSEQEKESLQRTLLSSLKVQPEPTAPAQPVAEIKQALPATDPASAGNLTQPVRSPGTAATLTTATPAAVAAAAEVKAALSEVKASPAGKAVPAVDQVQSGQVQAATELVIPDNWLENGRPEWAQQRFECLLFSVAGLKLAVPLVCLGGIHAVQNADDLTPLPGMPDWFVGLMPTGQGNLRVVDTARWVMPERKLENYKQQMRYVIRISGSDWGLACDEVDRSFSMMPDEVRWRTGRSKRPWLAGTVIEHMCALMDVDAFNRLLQESERRNRYKKG